MNKNATFFLTASLCLITSCVFFSPKPAKKTFPRESITSDKGKHVDNDEFSPQTTGVAVGNSETEKYILKYDIADNRVNLITKKENGTEFSSHIESINPYYLTANDINLLSAGVELTSKEELFMLIEDLSS